MLSKWGNHSYSGWSHKSHFGISPTSKNALGPTMSFLAIVNGYVLTMRDLLNCFRLLCSSSSSGVCTLKTWYTHFVIRIRPHTKKKNPISQQRAVFKFSLVSGETIPSNRIRVFIFLTTTANQLFSWSMDKVKSVLGFFGFVDGTHILGLNVAADGMLERKFILRSTIPISVTRPIWNTNLAPWLFIYLF